MENAETLDLVIAAGVCLALVLGTTLALRDFAAPVLGAIVGGTFAVVIVAVSTFFAVGDWLLGAGPTRSADD